MRYLQGLTTIPATESDNPLILGQMVHTGIEKSLEEAIREYCFSFPIITDEHINEIIKFETVIPLARRQSRPVESLKLKSRMMISTGLLITLYPPELNSG